MTVINTLTTVINRQVSFKWIITATCYALTLSYDLLSNVEMYKKNNTIVSIDCLYIYCLWFRLVAYRNNTDISLTYLIVVLDILSYHLSLLSEFRAVCLYPQQFVETLMSYLCCWFIVHSVLHEWRVRVTWLMSDKRQEVFTLREHLGPPALVGYLLPIF